MKQKKQKKPKRRHKVTQRIPLLVIFYILAAGVAALAYPKVGDWVSAYTAKLEISAYAEAVEQEDNSDLEEMLAEAQAYNTALGSGADEESLASYDDLLAVTDAIGYLEIPKISVYMPIYHGVDDEVLQKGIGHLPGTSLPVGGASTHCVLSGHTGLPAAKILTDLDQMEEGDMFYLHVLNETLAYEVDQIKVVLPDETDDIQIVPGEDYVTLLTCTPYGVNSHRLLVRGARVEYVPETVTLKDAQTSAGTVKIPVRIILTAGAALLALLLLILTAILLFAPMPFDPRDDKEEETDKGGEG